MSIITPKEYTGALMDLCQTRRGEMKRMEYLSPERVELDYEIPLGVTRLILVPSVVIRPFSMVNDAGSGVVLAYPVDDEHLVDDPDAPDPAAPKMTWVHWVLYNIPADALGLDEGVSAQGLPQGTREGLNDWKRAGYDGPCPPVGRHRYYHKLYALDTTLPEMSRPTKAEVEAAMQGHVLAQAQLMGVYQKSGR